MITVYRPLLKVSYLLFRFLLERCYDQLAIKYDLRVLIFPRGIKEIAENLKLTEPVDIFAIESTLKAFAFGEYRIKDSRGNLIALWIHHKGKKQIWITIGSILIPCQKDKLKTDVFDAVEVDMMWAEIEKNPVWREVEEIS